jgi:histidinol-phosphate aminotransferase
VTFLNPDDSVIIPAATFSAYSLAARMIGASEAVVPMKEDLSIDVSAIAQAVSKSTKMIFLCAPNNPTGTIITGAEFDSLLEKLAFMPIQPLLIVDQAYLDFVSPDSDCLNAIKYVTEYNNVAVLRTFSKISGLAGLRIGYMIAHPNMLSYMYKSRPPFTVNSLAQIAALTDVQDPSAREFRENVNKSVRKSRGELEAFLKGSRVSYAPSQANFVFAFFDRPREEILRISGELAKRGIIVRTLWHEMAPDGLRFSIGTPDENKKLIKALKEILADSAGE